MPYIDAILRLYKTESVPVPIKIATKTYIESWQEQPGRALLGLCTGETYYKHLVAVGAALKLPILVDEPLPIIVDDSCTLE